MLAYGYIAGLSVVVVLVTSRLASKYPVNGSLCHFQLMFLSPAIGWSNNLIYWMSWLLTLALELSILVQLLDFWGLASLPLLTIFAIWGCLTVVNLLPVNVFGRVEYGISLIKVTFIILWMGVIAAAVLGANPAHKPIGFTIWFAQLPQLLIGLASPTNAGLNLWSSLVSASFTFQSIELIALTAGELKDPRAMGQITRLVFFRIMVFYLASIFFLTLVIPFNDPALSTTDDTLLLSPFIVALSNCHYNSAGLTSLFNFIIFTALLSAANSNIYFGLRCLLAMAEESQLTLLSETSSQGVPYVAVLCTAAFGLVALTLRVELIHTVFNSLLACCASAGLLMWCLLCFSYVRFEKAQGVKTKLRTAAKFAGVNIAVIILTSGMQSRLASEAFSAYLTPIAFVGLWVFFGWNKPLLVKVIDNEVASPTTQHNQVEQ